MLNDEDDCKATAIKRISNTIKRLPITIKTFLVVSRCHPTWWWFRRGDDDGGSGDLIMVVSRTNIVIRWCDRTWLIIFGHGRRVFWRKDGLNRFSRVWMSQSRFNHRPRIWRESWKGPPPHTSCFPSSDTWDSRSWHGW
jgi:hypothetical protein